MTKTDRDQKLQYRVAALETIIGITAKNNKDQIAAEAKEVIGRSNVGEDAKRELIKDVYRILRARLPSYKASTPNALESRRADDQNPNLSSALQSNRVLQQNWR